MRNKTANHPSQTRISMLVKNSRGLLILLECKICRNLWVVVAKSVHDHMPDDTCPNRCTREQS